MAFRHTIKLEQAEKIWDWLQNRGGIAVWHSINLSNLGRTWTTPVLDEEGNLVKKPTWEADSVPAEVILNPDDILVSKDQEVKRFHVAVRVSGNGLMLKCKPGSSNRILRAVSKAGDGAYHEFDYWTQEAVIMAPVDRFSLTEWYQYFQSPKEVDDAQANRS